MGQKIIVVGGGIIGASIAWHLHHQGAEVTVLDAGHANATDASFGWVNASYFANRDHYDLRWAGMRAWRDILPELGITPGAEGCLCWDQPDDVLQRQHDELSALGYPVDWVSGKNFRQMEPNIGLVPSRALYFPAEMVIDPARVAGVMLQAVQVLHGVQVRSIHDGTTLYTTAGVFSADKIVIAAGTKTVEILAPLGIHIPMRDSPTLVLRTQPVDRLCNHVLASPLGDVRQRSDGSFIMPADIHHQSTDTPLAALNVEDMQSKAMQRLHTLLPGVKLQAAGMTLAHRPMPQDGLPVVGLVHEDIYVAVMHSGVTLAAVIGSYAAAEVLSGTTNQTHNHLISFRPERFEGA